MILSSLKKISVATLGSAALALGMGSTALAQTASITAVTSGIDSGFDSVATQIQNDPQVLNFLNVQLPALAAQYNGPVTLRTLLSSPQLPILLADPILDPSLAQALSATVPVLLLSNDPQVTNVLDDPFDLDAVATNLSILLANEVGDDFFTVGFNAGPLDAFVESVTFDLGQGDFDFEVFSLDANPEVGQVSGLNIADISFSEVTSSAFDSPVITTELTIFFAPQSFGVGDSFSFGVDTNKVGDDYLAFLEFLNPLANHDMPRFNDSGDDFGLADVTFSVTLENGASGEGTFETVGPYTSVAQTEVVWDDETDPTSVPEPGMVMGLLAIAGASCRRKILG